MKLSSNEQKLLKALKKGKLKSVPDVKLEIERHIEYAKNTSNKIKLANFRIDDSE